MMVKPGEYVITEPIHFHRLHHLDDRASPSVGRTSRSVKNIVVRSEVGAEMRRRVAKFGQGVSP